MFFLKEQRNLCISSLPEGMTVMKEVVKEVANIWSIISEEKRAPYKLMAEIDKCRFDDQIYEQQI